MTFLFCKVYNPIIQSCSNCVSFVFRMGVFVPTGLAAFPGELMHCPRSWAQTKYRNIYSYTFMPRGGHFAAFEEPQLLANDLVQFVKNVEKV